MKALKFTITLREPVLMSRPLAGEENSSVSENFIPGSALRGAAIRACQEHMQKAFDLADAHLRRLFFRGGFFFLNAYPNFPTNEDWERSLPCPLSWMTYKDEDEEQVYDLTLSPPAQDKTVKAVSPRYFWRRDEGFAGWSPRLQNVVHNASMDRNHKKAGDSTVFRYESIPAGSVFAGAVLGESEEDLEQLKTWLENTTVLLGGSHTAGYGHVQLHFAAGIKDWVEYIPGEDDEEETDGQVAVILLSNAILRRPDGQTTGDLGCWLSARLGKEIHLEKSFCRLGLVGGYNRKAGMPLPQDWALEAGSTFVFKAGQIQTDELASWVERGIGERREEGFGRIAVDLNRRFSFVLPALTDQPVVYKQPDALSEASRRLAHQTAQRILRGRLDQRLVLAVNQTRLTGPLPKNSQLSRLRDAAEQAAAQNDLTVLTRHIGQLKDAVKQLERCRVNNGARLIDWLHACADKPQIPEAFKWDETGLPIVAGVSAEISNELKVEYTARFLEGLFRKTARTRSEGGDR